MQASTTCKPTCHARRNCSPCLQRRAIEDWHKNTTPIGVPPKNPVEEVAPEDESDEDDDEGTAVQCFVCVQQCSDYCEDLGTGLCQAQPAVSATHPGRPSCPAWTLLSACLPSGVLPRQGLQPDVP